MKLITKNLMLIITIILAIVYTGCTVYFTSSSINQISQIINATIISLASIIFTYYYSKKEKLIISATLINILLVAFLFINTLNISNIYVIPTQQILFNLTTKSLDEVLTLAKKNNIKINIVYENSENIPEYNIISQDISESTLLSNVKELKLVVSDGKDPNKLIIIPNMLGWTTEKVTNFVKENGLTNIDIEFVKSNETKNTVIEQSKNGELKRSDNFLLKFSQDMNFEFTGVEMIDLKNKTLFEATLWAKENGLNLNKEFSFNDDLKDVVSLKNADGNPIDILKIKKGIIINQKEEIGTFIEDPNITVTISKGNKIIIPNFKEMSIEDITLFAMQNKLKVSFTDRYDEIIEIGKIIETNFKEGDVVEEGSTITVLSSKGQLKMESFDSLDSFREWANKYNIATAEIFETNNEVPEGTVIKYSHAENTVLSISDTVTVYISKGPAVIMPSLVGKTKAQAISALNNASLTYSITYSSYNDAARDTVLAQSISANSSIEKGTKVIITLSKGPGITVPNLTGKDKNSISSTCNALGIRVNFVTGGYSNTPENCATNQSIGAGNKVDSGASITVTLSKGPAKSQSVYLQPQWITPGNASSTASNITTNLKAIYSDLNVNISYVATNEPNKTGLVAMDPTITITQGSSVTIKIYK